MSDAVVIALGTGFLTFCGVALQGYLAYALASQRAKVEEVKQTLAAATTATDAKLSEIKHLADGAFGGQMRLTWMALQRAADASGVPADQVAATEAKRLYDEHIANDPDSPKGP